MTGKALVAVVPFYSDVPRLNRCDLAAIRAHAVEPNAGAYFEIFRLFGGHFDFSRPAKAE